MNALSRFALVDVDSCFAACERIFHPHLYGVPIVVLSNNDGCVVAMSREAKSMGIAMGTPWFKIEAWAARAGVVARSSNYELYGSISARIMEILRGFSARVEVYSIDEAFLGFHAHPREIVTTCRAIRAKIFHDLGVPVSIGVAPTRTLAKMASKGAKKTPSLDGVATFDAYSAPQVDAILESTPVGSLWGVGRRFERRLVNMEITTALQLRGLDPVSARTKFNVNLSRTIYELRGVPCIDIEDRDAIRKEQVMFSRSFSTPITSAAEMCQVLSIYAQKVTARLRRQGLEAGSVWVFAASSWYKEPFFQASAATEVQPRTDNPAIVYRAAQRLLIPRLVPGAHYVRAGISLGDLRPRGYAPMLDPFMPARRASELGALVDQVNTKFGDGAVGLGLAGLKRPPSWQMKRDMLSNRGTTHWDELTTIFAR